jgi:hypothetical protein
VLSIRQSQQARDTDLSNRALAAAQAAARDAASWIRQNPGDQYPNCNDSRTNLTKPVLDTAADNQVSIVCRTVQTSSATLSGQLAADDSVQFNTSANQVQKVKFEWNKLGTDSNNGFFTNNAINTQWYDLKDAYAALGSQPATLEVSIIYWPTGALPPNLPISTVVLLPGRQDKSPFRTPNGIPSNYNPYVQTNILSSSCGPSSTGQYSCNAIINLGDLTNTNPTATRYMVRVHSRFNQASYQASFYNSNPTNGTPDATAVSSKALIDVTAKAGNLYRRLQAELPIGGSSLFDAVVYSSQPICKNLSVERDYSLASLNACR